MRRINRGRPCCSHWSPQAASAVGRQFKWATQEEIHRSETAGADSSKESLLWSKFTIITSPLSWDAVSFFSNVGKSWAQQKLNVVLPFPSGLAAMVDGIVNVCLGGLKNLLWESNPRRGNPLCVQGKNKPSWTEQTSEEIYFDLQQMQN